MKKRGLIIVGLVVCIALLSTGAFAYFTAQGTASGNIHAGTLKLAIQGMSPSDICPSNIDPNQTTTTLWSLDKIKPGDEITGKLCMQNTGNLDIPQVGFKWSGMNGLLAEHLFVTKLYNSGTQKDEINDYIASCGSNNKMSLAQLDACGGDGDSEYWVKGLPVFLTPNQVQYVEYTFVFDPDAGNEFQNMDFNYTLNITGYQNPQYPQ
jgi:predicted ribosomally synthesized peptide with SipW-like signal peptide